MKVALFALALMAAAGPAGAQAAKAGKLVALPCVAKGDLRPVNRGYCAAQRHYVSPAARQSLSRVVAVMKRHGLSVQFMEASWPIGVRPMPPHYSHGDGRQIDLAVYYRSNDGKPLNGPPTRSGYGAFEPPRTAGERACPADGGHHDKPDPPANRAWRLDEKRTAQLVAALIADPGVQRIFLEPHLKRRLGFAAAAKVRFAGCRAARHDDHIHVDFY